MSYATQEDLEAQIGAARVTELSKPEGVVVVVPKILTRVDGEIDLYQTEAWTDAQKNAAAVAISLLLLYQRGAKGKIPEDIKDEANLWRSRLETAGQKASGRGTWYSVAYDPARGESAAELTRLRTGA